MSSSSPGRTGSNRSRNLSMSSSSVSYERRCNHGTPSWHLQWGGRERAYVRRSGHDARHRHHHHPHPQQPPLPSATSSSTHQPFPITLLQTSAPALHFPKRFLYFPPSPSASASAPASSRTTSRCGLLRPHPPLLPGPLLLFGPRPAIEFKLSLQRRRTSWRLSPTISSTHYPDPPTETPSIVDFPADDEDGDDLIGTVAGEVMRIARELPDNMTIGEALEGFQGGKKLTHWECLEVLKQMEKHAMVGCALYFFEWMMMQVPSPIFGKACSVFFGFLTIDLGKWGFRACNRDWEGECHYLPTHKQVAQ